MRKGRTELTIGGNGRGETFWIESRKLVHGPLLAILLVLTLLVFLNVVEPVRKRHYHHHQSSLVSASNFHQPLERARQYLQQQKQQQSVTSDKNNNTATTNDDSHGQEDSTLLFNTVARITGTLEESSHSLMSLSDVLGSLERRVQTFQTQVSGFKLRKKRRNVRLRGEYDASSGSDGTGLPNNDAAELGKEDTLEEAAQLLGGKATGKDDLGADGIEITLPAVLALKTKIDKEIAAYSKAGWRLNEKMHSYHINYERWVVDHLAKKMEKKKLELDGQEGNGGRHVAHIHEDGEGQEDQHEVQHPATKLPGPSYVHPPDPLDRIPSEEEKTRKRQESVVEEFLHSWKAYERFAWGDDELKPLSKIGKNWQELGKGTLRRRSSSEDESRNNDDSGEQVVTTGGSLGLSILDASTTIAIMGLEEPLEKVIKYLTSGEWSFTSKSIDMSQFEAMIRVVGSLISLYQLTGEKHPKLLEKAQEAADALLPAYETRYGLPDTTVNLKYKNHSNPDWRMGANSLAEVGTCQLELRTLTYLTKKSKYDWSGTAAFLALERKFPPDLLPPTMVNVTSGLPASKTVSIGGLSDSFYEYLLKQYLLTNRTELKYRRYFYKSVKSILAQMLQYNNGTMKVRRDRGGTEDEKEEGTGEEGRAQEKDDDSDDRNSMEVPQSFAYVAQRVSKAYVGKTTAKAGLVRTFDHLSCFFPGTLALGAQELLKDGDDERAGEWMRIAADLTDTCFNMYALQKTGLSPEYVQFQKNGNMTNGDPYYLLRPEAMESMFYMWRLTKDTKYRDYGWKMFKAMKKWCRIDSGGYSGIKRVNDFPVKYDDVQQSFWLAETLKYTYLLFSDDEKLNLDEWVLNTEAHPLKIADWDPREFIGTKEMPPESKETAQKIHVRKRARINKKTGEILEILN